MTSRRSFIHSVSLATGVLVLPGKVFSNSLNKELVNEPEKGRSGKSIISKLIEAVTAGNLLIVEKLLNADKELLYARTGNDISMYSLAFFNRHEAVAKFFTDSGYIPDLFDHAAAGKPDKIREAFKERPELAFITNRFGYSLLHYAALAGQTVSVDSLIGGPSVSPDAVAKDEGQTPAMLFMLQWPDAAAAYQMMFSCLSNGANPNLADKNKYTLLHKAAETGNLKVVELLLRKGAAINITDINGNTPLSIAKTKSNNNIIKALEDRDKVRRDKYITRTRADKNGHAPVTKNDTGIPQVWVDKFTSVAHFDAEESARMIKKCPDLVYCRSAWDELPVEGCAHIGTAAVMNVLLDAGSPYSICTAASIGDFYKVKDLLKENPELIYERGPHDLPLIFYTAVTNGMAVDLAEILLNAGADINASASGRTALHHATAMGRSKLVDFLLQKGANQNIVCTSPFLYGTPMDIAKQFKRDNIIELLKKYQ